MVSYNQEDFEQEFHLFEGDLATDGHEHIRRSTLTIIDMEGKGSLRKRCLENLEANKNSLSFDLGSLFSDSRFTDNDVEMIDELNQKGFIRYRVGSVAIMRKGAEHIDNLTLEKISAYHIPTIISHLLIMKDGDIDGYLSFNKPHFIRPFFHIDALKDKRWDIGGEPHDIVLGSTFNYMGYWHGSNIWLEP